MFWNIGEGTGLFMSPSLSKLAMHMKAKIRQKRLAIRFGHDCTRSTYIVICIQISMFPSSRFTGIFLIDYKRPHVRNSCVGVCPSPAIFWPDNWLHLVKHNWIVCLNKFYYEFLFDIHDRICLTLIQRFNYHVTFVRPLSAGTSKPCWHQMTITWHSWGKHTVRTLPV